MKKRVSIVLVMALILSISSAFAQVSAPEKTSLIQPVQNVLMTKGVIKSVHDGRVWVAGSGVYNEEIILNIHNGSHILRAEDGRPVPLTGLKTGDPVTAYYGPAVMYSMPPQSNAIALMVGTPKTGGVGMYMKVAQLEINTDGSIRALCTNLDRLVTIQPDIFPQLGEIKAGSELIVWYEAMTASLPGQATATQVVLLPAKADIRIHTGAGVIVINGKELALSTDDRITTEGDTLMLPLRVMAESLGYSVVWDAATQSVMLQTGADTEASLAIGSKTYVSRNMPVHLDHAPQIIQGKTLVPVDFFTTVMQLTVDVNNGHI